MAHESKHICSSLQIVVGTIAALYLIAIDNGHILGISQSCLYQLNLLLHCFLKFKLFFMLFSCSVAITKNFAGSFRSSIQ